MLKTLVDEDGVKDVHHGLIYKESLEQQGGNGSALAEDEKSRIEPGARTVEDAQESNLWQICPEEKRCKDKGREEKTWQ